MKRFVAILLVVVLALSIFPMTVFAEYLVDDEYVSEAEVEAVESSEFEPEYPALDTEYVVDVSDMTLELFYEMLENIGEASITASSNVAAYHDIFYTNVSDTSDKFLAVIDGTNFMFLGSTAIPNVNLVQIVVGGLGSHHLQVENGMFIGGINLRSLPTGTHRITMNVHNGRYFVGPIGSSTGRARTLYVTKIGERIFFDESDVLTNNRIQLDILHRQNPNNFLSTSGPDVRATASELATLRTRATQITAGARTDVERAFAIYEWIAKNIAYDFDELARWEAGITGGETQRPFTVYNSRQAFCQGFAELTNVMLRSIGIPSEFVFGMLHTNLSDVEYFMTNHGWNYVFLRDEGFWIAIDTTSGASYAIRDGIRTQVEPFASFPGYNYSDAWFDVSCLALSRTHFIDGFGVLGTRRRTVHRTHMTLEHNNRAAVGDTITINGTFSSRVTDHTSLIWESSDNSGAVIQHNQMAVSGNRISVPVTLHRAGEHMITVVAPCGARARTYISVTGEAESSLAEFIITEGNLVNTYWLAFNFASNIGRGSAFSVFRINNGRVEIRGDRFEIVQQNRSTYYLLEVREGQPPILV
ncbi:MAG: transglutaminase-like domain-containing protein [Oscillospiraceae bacterium]|nr:transglutaminase-like domain-containing protein [Oscillospiraceae bacterium]